MSTMAQSSDTTRDSLSAKDETIPDLEKQEPIVTDSTVPTEKEAQPATADTPVSTGENAAPAPGPPPYSSFSSKRKASIMAIITVTGFLGPLSGNIYIPILPKLKEIFHTSTTAINATVSVFMFIMALSPLLWAGFADRGGRKMLYLMSLIFFIVANILLAAVPANIAALFILRIVQAFGASSVLSVGAGTVADIVEPKHRGKAMSYFMLGPQLGPVIGPILSVISKGSDNAWRWIFGLLAILGTVVYLAILFCLPETLRFLVGDGSALNLQGCFVKPKLRQEKLVQGFPRPPKPSIMNYMRLLRYIPVALSCVNSALLFAGFYAMSVEFSSVLQSDYDFSQLAACFSYVCPGISLIAGSITSGRISDHMKKKHSTPEHRIPLQLPGLLLTICGLLVFGWCADKHIHVVTLFVGTFLTAFGMSWVFVILTTYLTECFRAQSASGVALVNMFRNAAAGISSLIIHVLIKKMTIGWAFTGLALCLLIPVTNVLIIMWKGQQWRTELQERLNRK